MGLDRPNRLPEAVREVLADADRLELLSLDPKGGATPEPGRFWGWRVLGSTAIELPEVRQEVFTALERGIAENQGWMAFCFDPRHGIRAARGVELVELVVCFECSQVQIYTDGKWDGSVLIMGSPEPVFDRVLSAAGVPLADKHAW
jgi:hypothetical protein